MTNSAVNVAASKPLLNAGRESTESCVSAKMVGKLDSKSVVAPPNKLLPIVYVRSLATNNDHFRHS